MENENNFKETVGSLFKGMDGFVSAKTVVGDRKNTRLNSSHSGESRMPSSA